jgi:hypothetical protein
MPIEEEQFVNVKSLHQIQKELMEKISEMISSYHVQVSLSVIDQTGKPVVNFSNLGTHFHRTEHTEIQLPTKSEPVKVQLEKEAPDHLKKGSVTPNRKTSGTRVILPEPLNGAQFARELAVKKVNILSYTNTDLTVQLLDDDEAYNFSRNFHGNTSISKLIIKGLDSKGIRKAITMKGWIHVVPCFREFQSIAISGCKIGMDEAIMIMTNLNQNLKDLDFWDNLITDDVALYIVESILRNQMIINVLNLGSNDFTSETKLTIKKMLKNTGISVELY